MRKMHPGSKWPGTPAGRAFLASFAVTFALILLVGGILFADYHCRSAAFGDKTAPLSLSVEGEKTFLNIDTLGIEKTLDVSGGAQAWQFICDFICVPTG